MSETFTPGFIKKLFDQLDQLTLVKNQLYLLPRDLIDLKSLRVYRPGWFLGTFHQKRFLPSHALALSITTDDVNHMINLPADSSAIIRYLTGDTIESSGDSGWTLVCADGFPIGWGRRTGNKIKNYFPHHLRWTGS